MLQRFRREESSDRGYTLVEMLAALTLFAILALTALPNISTLAGKSRVHDAARQVETAFQLARMKAINERMDHVVQFTSRGWNVFVDKNKNGTREVGEGWLLAAPAALPPGVRFSSPVAPPSNDLPITASGCRCVRYQPNGTMVVGSTTTSRYLTIGDGKDYRRVNVSTAGAIRVQRWIPSRSAWE